MINEMFRVSCVVSWKGWKDKIEHPTRIKTNDEKEWEENEKIESKCVPLWLSIVVEGKGMLLAKILSSCGCEFYRSNKLTFHSLSLTHNSTLTSRQTESGENSRIVIMSLLFLLLTDIQTHLVGMTTVLVHTGWTLSFTVSLDWRPLNFLDPFVSVSPYGGLVHWSFLLFLSENGDRNLI